MIECVPRGAISCSGSNLSPSVGGRRCPVGGKGIPMVNGSMFEAKSAKRRDPIILAGASVASEASKVKRRKK